MQRNKIPTIFGDSAEQSVPLSITTEPTSCTGSVTDLDRQSSDYSSCMPAVWQILFGGVVLLWTRCSRETPSVLVMLTQCYSYLWHVQWHLHQLRKYATQKIVSLSAWYVSNRWIEQSYLYQAGQLSSIDDYCSGHEICLDRHRETDRQTDR